MSASKPCKLCAQGHKPKDGQHWIVKSIIPARIDIRKCTNFTPAVEPKFITRIEDLA